MPIRTRVAVLLLVILAAALTSANNRVQAASLGPGDHTIALEHGGRERSAIVHVSRRAGEKSALPVVLNFHGGGGHGANQKEYSLLDSVAESESFVAVYPNGNGRFESRLSVVDHADFSVEPLNGVSKGGEHPLWSILLGPGSIPRPRSRCVY